LEHFTENRGAKRDFAVTQKFLEKRSDQQRHFDREPWTKRQQNAWSRSVGKSQFVEDKQDCR